MIIFVCMEWQVTRQKNTYLRDFGWELLNDQLPKNTLSALCSYIFSADDVSLFNQNQLQEKKQKLQDAVILNNNNNNNLYIQLAFLEYLLNQNNGNVYVFNTRNQYYVYLVYKNVMQIFRWNAEQNIWQCTQDGEKTICFNRYIIIYNYI